MKKILAMKYASFSALAGTLLLPAFVVPPENSSQLIILAIPDHRLGMK